MTHDKHVRVHGRKVVDGIEQRLALARGRRIDIQVDDVRRESLRGNLERGPGARGVLEEQVENGLAAQQRHFLDLAIRHADELFGGIENMRDDRARKSFYGEQMLEFAVLRELRIAFEKTVARRRRFSVRHAAFGRTLSGRVHRLARETSAFMPGWDSAACAVSLDFVPFPDSLSFVKGTVEYP